MSSALSSVRTRRTNPQTATPPAPVTRNGPTPVGNRNIPYSPAPAPSTTYNPNPISNQTPSPNPGAVGTPTAGLSLHQIIDIYGKRILQLESFMNQNKSTPLTSGSQSHPDSGISLEDVQALIDSKLDVFQRKREKEASQTQDEVLQEFHSRFELLANEIADLKDVVLQLQRYTMTVNKVLIENAGLLKNNQVMEETFTLGNLTEVPEDIVEDITGEEVEFDTYEEETDPSNESTVGDYFK